MGGSADVVESSGSELASIGAALLGAHVLMLDYGAEKVGVCVPKAPEEQSTSCALQTPRWILGSGAASVADGRERQHLDRGTRSSHNGTLGVQLLVMLVAVLPWVMFFVYKHCRWQHRERRLA